MLNPLGINCLRIVPGHRPRRLGRAHAARRRPARRRVQVRPGPPRSRCSSRRACTAARSGWSSSRTTSRCGRRSGSTSARSCTNLFRQGAFQGTTPREAYFVKCDKETTTQNDINLGHRQHPRRLRAAEAGRVRDHQDPADRRPDSRPEEDDAMAQFSVNAAALRPLQELQVPREVGRPLRRRRQQGRRAQAHDRGRQAPRGRRPEHAAASRRAAPSTRRSRSSAASRTTPSSSSGPTRSGTSAPGSAPRSRSRTSARTSSSRSTTRPASSRSPTRSSAAGSRSSRRCPTSTPTPTPSRSSTSSWRTKAGSATSTCHEPAEPTVTSRPRP